MKRTTSNTPLRNPIDEAGAPSFVETLPDAQRALVNFGVARFGEGLEITAWA